MIFLSISYFRNALQQLLKAKRDEYKSIKHDIAKMLNGKQPEDLFSYHVCLLYTYPKRGSLGQIDISDNDLADYVEEYINKLKDKTLICHDITKELSINKKYLCKNETCIHEQTNCTTNE